MLLTSSTRVARRAAPRLRVAVIGLFGLLVVSLTGCGDPDDGDGGGGGYVAVVSAGQPSR